MDQEFQAAVAFYASEYEVLCRMCARTARASQGRLTREELLSDVVLQNLPELLQRVEPGRTPRNYVLSNLRWMLYKHLQALEPLRDTEALLASVPDNESNTIGQLEQERVSKFVEDLCQYDRLLIKLHFEMGYTRRKIADLTDSTFYSVNRDLQRVLGILRTRLEGEDLG